MDVSLKSLMDTILEMMIGLTTAHLLQYQDRRTQPMYQKQTVKLSVVEPCPDEFEHVVDMASICSNVLLQATKSGNVYWSAALTAYHADKATGKIDLEFDQLALDVLGLGSAIVNTCLRAIAKAPWAKLQVHDGSYGEAIFLFAKPTS